jgi:hypothetical protein
MLFARLAAYVAIIMVIAVLFPQGGTAVLCAIVLFWLSEFAVQALFRTQTVGISFEPNVQGRTNVEFSNDGIVEQGASRTRRWNWDSLRRVHLPTGYVVIEFMGWDMIVLPDGLWATSEERSEFIAELEARQTAPDPTLDTEAPRKVDPQFKLVEPVLIARLFLTVQAFQLILDNLLSFGRHPDPNSASIALAGAFLGSAIIWWAAGRAFRWLEARSPSQALAAAWGVIVLLSMVFALWYFGQI